MIIYNFSSTLQMNKLNYQTENKQNICFGYMDKFLTFQSLKASLLGRKKQK